MSNNNATTEAAVTRRASSAPSTSSSRSQHEAALLPPVDVIEDPTGITLYADVPGLSKERLELHVEADALTIEGELDLALPEGMQASHVEVGVGRYRRVFTLSKELDTAKVTAELANGVLKLRIPRAEHAQPRRIEVKAG